MNKKITKSIAVPLIAVFIMQVAACGTILHPERKGQISGQLDAKIVALDAIGLLFFLVPGVISFAVDFSNGTIYLPNGSASVDADSVNIVNVEGELNNNRIESVILKETGKSIDLNDSEVRSDYKELNLSKLSQEVRLL